jgi:hypothetical protein
VPAFNLQGSLSSRLKVHIILSMIKRLKKAGPVSGGVAGALACMR